MKMSVVDVLLKRGNRNRQPQPPPPPPPVVANVLPEVNEKSETETSISAVKDAFNSIINGFKGFGVTSKNIDFIRWSTSFMVVLSPVYPIHLRTSIIADDTQLWVAFSNTILEMGASTVELSSRMDRPFLCIGNQNGSLVSSNMGLIEQIIIKGGHITGAPHAVSITDAKDVVIEGFHCEGKVTITHSSNIVLKNCQIKGGVDTDDTSCVSLEKCETFINVEENDELDDNIDLHSPTISSIMGSPDTKMLEDLSFFYENSTCASLQSRSATADSALTFDFGMLERPASASSSASQGSGPRSVVSAHTV